MDRTTAGLEPDPCPDGHLLCRAYARVTLPGPDTKGKMNGSTALDIRPHQRYVVEKAVTENLLPPQINFALLHLNRVYTEFGIDPYFDRSQDSYRQ